MMNSRWIGAGACALLCVGCAAESSSGLGFGALLSRTLLVLFAVSVLAVVSLRWLAGRGFGKGAAAGAAFDVLERIPVGPRQSVIAVRAADRVLIIGVSGQRFDALGDVELLAWQRADATTRAALVTASSGAPADAVGKTIVVEDRTTDAPTETHPRTFSEVLAASEAPATSPEAMT